MILKGTSPGNLSQELLVQTLTQLNVGWSLGQHKKLWSLIATYTGPKHMDKNNQMSNQLNQIHRMKMAIKTGVFVCVVNVFHTNHYYRNCPHALADGSYSIRIREKILEFSSVARASITMGEGGQVPNNIWTGETLS